MRALGYGLRLCVDRSPHFLRKNVANALNCGKLAMGYGLRVTSFTERVYTHIAATTKCTFGNAYLIYGNMFVCKVRI